MPRGRLRLFCFSFAGGGAIDFRDWSRDCPDGVEVYAIQLPGRGARIHEPPLTRIEDVANVLAGAVAGLLDRPYALFGHSLGGRVGFALARRLKVLGRPAPQVLAVSACRAPGLSGINVANLSDDAFLRHIATLGGTTSDVLGNAELMELILPVLRADFLLHDSLEAGPPRLDCPVLACGGTEDPNVVRADLEAWRGVGGGFDLRLFPGGHFYLREQRRELIATLMARCAAVAEAG